MRSDGVEERSIVTKSDRLVPVDLIAVVVVRLSVALDPPPLDASGRGEAIGGASGPRPEGVTESDSGSSIEMADRQVTDFVHAYRIPAIPPAARPPVCASTAQSVDDPSGSSMEVEEAVVESELVVVVVALAQISPHPTSATHPTTEDNTSVSVRLGAIHSMSKWRGRDQSDA